MTVKVSINGLGRIGRAALKVIMDTPELELVAANDIGTLENMAYLLKYDTVYGRYEKSVDTLPGKLVIDGNMLMVRIYESATTADYAYVTRFKMPIPSHLLELTLKSGITLATLWKNAS